MHDKKKKRTFHSWQMLQNGNIYVCSKKQDVVILEERQKAKQKQKQIVTQGGDENFFSVTKVTQKKDSQKQQRFKMTTNES